MFENLDFMKIGGITIISSPYFVPQVLKRNTLEAPEDVQAMASLVLAAYPTGYTTP